MELTGILEGRYEILSRLGSGAFGEVYRALDQRLNREVAIKRLRIETMSEASERRNAQSRFLQEARIAAQLQHPNIVTVHDVVGTSELLFMVLELIEGETLQDRVFRRSSLDPFETLAILKPAAAAIDFANEAGVVHRDVKPANIMIDKKGNVKVADFGIAKIDNTSGLTATGYLIGTPNYMSPEQARGEPVDHRSDIFSLGCVLFECLSGRKAFDGESVTAVLLKIVGNQPEPFEAAGDPLHQELLSVLDRALAHEKGDRFPSATELMQALETATASTTHKSPAQVLEATILASRKLALDPTIESPGSGAEGRGSAPIVDRPGATPSSHTPQSPAPNTLPASQVSIASGAPPGPDTYTTPPWTRYWPLAIVAAVLLIGISGASLWLGRMMASERSAQSAAGSGAGSTDAYVVIGDPEADRPSWQQGQGSPAGMEFADGGGFEDLEVRRPDPTPRPQQVPAPVEQKASEQRPASAAASQTGAGRSAPSQPSVAETEAEAEVEQAEPDPSPVVSEPARPKPAAPLNNSRPGPGEEYRKTLEVRVGVELDVEPDETLIRMNGRILGIADDIDEDLEFDRPGTYSFQFTAPNRTTQWWLVKVHADADDKWEDLEVDLKKIRKKKRRGASW